jgi:hypothetical protein
MHLTENLTLKITLIFYKIGLKIRYPDIQELGLTGNDIYNIEKKCRKYLCMGYMEKCRDLVCQTGKVMGLYGAPNSRSKLFDHEIHQNRSLFRHL